MAVLPVTPAQAAVAVGTDFGATNVAAGTGAMTAISGAYTVGAGANRLLVVVAMWEAANTANTASFTSGSYGGQALTSFTLNGSGSLRNRIWIGYLKEAGITAAASTTLNLNIANSSAPTGWSVKAAWFSGVDQVTPINQSVNSGTDTAGAATHTFGSNLTVNNGGRAIYIEVTNQNTTYSPVPTGYTENFSGCQVRPSSDGEAM